MRIAAFFFVILVCLLLPWWCLFVVAIPYTARWFAVELLLLAAIVDVIFSFSTIPYSVIAVAIIIMIAEWCKSVLSVY